MPVFEYVGDDERTFPADVGTVAPGDVVEAAHNPDPRYFKTAKKSAKPDMTEEP